MLFNNDIIVTEDYPHHYYQLLVSKHFFSEWKTEIYDPFFISGNLFGIDFFSMDIFLILIGDLLFFLPSVLAFKFYIYFFNLIAPLVIYFTARNFNLKKSESTIAALITVIIWQFDWLIHQMNNSGVFSFIFASYLCVFTISVFYKCLLTNKRKYLAFATFLCFLSVLIHPYSVIILIVPLIVFTFFFKQLILKKKEPLSSSIPFLTTLIFIIIFLSSFFFMLNRIDYLITYFEPSIFHQSEGLKTILFELQERPVQTFIFFLGFFGIYFWRKEKEICVLFLMTSIFYFIYSYFGSFINIISFFQPQRVIVPLTFLLILPSVKAIQYIVIKVKPHKEYIIIFVILLLFFNFFKTSDLYLKIRRNEIQEILDRRIITSIPTDVQNIMSWIKTNTTSEARILIENGEPFLCKPYGGCVVALFPYFTNREFIVAPLPGASLKKEFIPDFYEGKLFNKNVTNFSSTELDEYFNTYNIKWIVVWSNMSKNVFDNSSQVSKIEQIGVFSIYETNIQPTFFLKGSGVINANYDKIMISNATEGEIIIKYNFFRELKTDPILEIGLYEMSGAHLGFIRISNKNITEFKIFIKADLTNLLMKR